MWYFVVQMDKGETDLFMFTLLSTAQDNMLAVGFDLGCQHGQGLESPRSRIMLYGLTNE